MDQYMKHIKESGTENWISYYVCVMALNSTVDGPSSNKIYEIFSNIMAWIYEKTKSESGRLKSATGYLISQLTCKCP